MRLEHPSLQLVRMFYKLPYSDDPVLCRVLNSEIWVLS